MALFPVISCPLIFHWDDCLSDAIGSRYLVYIRGGQLVLLFLRSHEESSIPLDSSSARCFFLVRTKIPRGDKRSVLIILNCQAATQESGLTPSAHIIMPHHTSLHSLY